MYKRDDSLSMPAEDCGERHPSIPGYSFRHPLRGFMLGVGIVERTREMVRLVGRATLVVAPARGRGAFEVASC
jgi:hypothetical protein